MAERGWTAPAWPREYGGAGLSVAETMILDEEMRRINAPAPLAGHGLTMIGPAILEFGTDAPMPGAPAAHRARRDPLVPGLQRTRRRLRLGQSANARRAGRATTTSSTARRSGRPGPTARTGSSAWCAPTRTLPSTRASPFWCWTWTRQALPWRPSNSSAARRSSAQTFLDDVRVPKRHLIGRPGEGWTVGKRLLQYERSAIGGRGGRQTADQDHRRMGQGISRRAGRPHRRPGRPRPGWPTSASATKPTS